MPSPMPISRQTRASFRTFVVFTVLPPGLVARATHSIYAPPAHALPGVPGGSEGLPVEHERRVVDQQAHALLGELLEEGAHLGQRLDQPIEVLARQEEQ